MIDPVAATEALLATLPPAAAARSDAYFEGGYWLLLWGTLWSAAAAWLMLRLGWSVRLRDLAERIAPRRFLQRLVFGAAFLVLITLLELPWVVYTDFMREHQYGLATQTFWPWLAEQAIELGVVVAMGSPAIAGLYAAIQRGGRAWWAFGGALGAAGLAFGILIAPVFIEPLFNDYTPMPAGALRDDILALARANGVPADDVFVFDASRQTNRISANVSGIFGTSRIALNDNLLAQCTPAEIRSVMAHEIGHYALGHVFTLLTLLSLVLTLGLLFVDRAFSALLRRSGDGAGGGVRGLGDLAGLPLLYAGLVMYLLLATPVTNSIVRVREAQADLFGLNAAREPDGFATTALKLSKYRKLAPSPLEEALMYDHPSGRSRILMAMTWKAAQQAQAAAAEPAQ